MVEVESMRWVFVIRLWDRPGALAAVASVFSDRGISLESIVGHGAFVETGKGTIVVSFTATDRKKQMALRTLERLSRVISVSEYTYESPNLRKTALVHLRRGFPANLLKSQGVVSEPIGSDSESEIFLLAGLPATLDEVLHRLEDSNVLMDSVYAVIAL